jgi:hypothetical protein
MSASTRLRTDFKMASDHIKDRVISNIVEAKNQGIIKVEDSELRKLNQVIESAFEQGFITSAVQIEKSINESLR